MIVTVRVTREVNQKKKIDSNGQGTGNTGGQSGGAGSSGWYICIGTGFHLETLHDSILSPKPCMIPRGPLSHRTARLFG
jgi:hypothetical protein